ncbi:hypothetical protein AUP68_16401 [Ilyonectria robusta]
MIPVGSMSCVTTPPTYTDRRGAHTATVPSPVHHPTLADSANNEQGQRTPGLKGKTPNGRPSATRLGANLRLQ